MELYRALLSQDYDRQMRYMHPDPIFFTLLSADGEQADETPALDIEEAQVETICRSLLSSEDYTLYSLRYKVGLTLREIAAYTARSTKTIMYKLNNIVARLRAYLCPAQPAIA